MVEKLLEIHQFDGEGYRPLIDFNCWRVAVLRYLDELQPNRISFLERHNETDEVFVLLQGQAVLFLGTGDEVLDSMHAHAMQPGVFYNVKRSAWHTAALSRDATILLVENRDTSRANSDYIALEPDQRAYLMETVEKEIQEWKGISLSSV